MKKNIMLFLLIWFISSKLIAGGFWHCAGAMKVKIFYENDSTSVGYITLRGYDVELFKQLGIQNPHQMTEVQKGIDILQYLSDEVTYREYTREIFEIPNILSCVSEENTSNIDVSKYINKIITIEWIGRDACQSTGFLKLPNKDIAALKNKEILNIIVYENEDGCSQIKYINSNPKISEDLFEILIYYNRFEIGNYPFVEAHKRGIDVSVREKINSEFIEYFSRLINYYKTNQIEIQEIDDYFIYLLEYYSEVIKLINDDSHYWSLDSKNINDLFINTLNNAGIITVSRGWD